MKPLNNLSDTEIELLFCLAQGYSGFKYHDSKKCWVATKVLGEGFQLASVRWILDADVVSDLHLNSNSVFSNPFIFNLNDDPGYVISLMKSEGINLSWGNNGEFRLTYGAFPEIFVEDHLLGRAIKRILISKELGVDSGHGVYINEKHLAEVNISKAIKE